jgi:hypothetical protein
LQQHFYGTGAVDAVNLPRATRAQPTREITKALSGRITVSSKSGT